MACGAPTVPSALPSSVATAPARTSAPGETVEPGNTAGAPTPNGTTVPANTTTPGSPAPGGEGSGQEGLLLTEVGLAPVAGDPAFVEITNTTSAPIDMTGSTLNLGQNGLPLGLTLPVAAGAQLLVLFDGLDSVEGTVIHAPSGLDLAPDRGVVLLVDRAAVRLDRVAWGDAEPNAVPAGPGGIVPATFEAGATISRAPGATASGASDEWIVNAPADASPGEANPMPTVSVLLPISGAILEPTQADLFWYPVPGATSYRVQVALEPTFGSPVLDATMTEPQVNLATLAPGAYSWRVQAVAADGGASRFSQVSNVELATASAGIATTDIAMAGVRGVAGTAVVDTPGKHLSVPLLSQHKDTQMLLLERNVERGTHAWDVDHGALDPTDPADKKNCALATVAMMSKFYGGNLSQDRLGYEILQHRTGQQPGPEGDLVYGHGITGAETSAAFKFALGDVNAFEYETYEAMWKDIVIELEAGRPIAAANSHHGFVITGYDVKAGHHRITVNDPWPGRTYLQDLDRTTLPASDLTVWLMPANPTVRHQEPSVTAHSDTDGVVDFDETERFHTNPNAADSDGDKVLDKQDIASGIFDSTYGYAKDPVPESAGRDFDSDGIPTERDPDSDTGGCLDGEEDTNLDGHRTGSETWNFDVSDDSCGYRIVGSYRLETGMVCLSAQPALVTDTIGFSLTPTDAGSFTVTDFTNSTTTFAPPEYLPGVTVTLDSPPEAFTVIGGTVTVTDYTLVVDLSSSSTIGSCTFTIPNEAHGQWTVPGMTIDGPIGFAFDPTETFVDGKLTFVYWPWTWVVTQRGEAAMRPG